ncbi:MAG: EVE domain-containing protein [Vampirovibrionales bacterium]|nr:EVE domain-containing protein [Vampirovibrionales bacterium]
MTHYWLMKTEPNEFSYEDLARDGRACWDGVRNHLAQRHLKQMAVGDEALIYHSVGPKSIVGIARITRTAYPDPTAQAGSPWMAVDIEPLKPLPHAVTLAQIKQSPSLAELPLIRQSRLSVMPVSDEAFRELLMMGGLEAVAAPPRREETVT